MESRTAIQDTATANIRELLIHLSKQPTTSVDEKHHSPFYLAIDHRRKPGCQVWYTKAPLGKNEVGKFLVKAVKAADLPVDISNHSVRKTYI